MRHGRDGWSRRWSTPLPQLGDGILAAMITSSPTPCTLQACAPRPSDRRYIVQRAAESLREPKRATPRTNTPSSTVSSQVKLHVRVCLSLYTSQIDHFCWYWHPSSHRPSTPSSFITKTRSSLIRRQHRTGVPGTRACSCRRQPCRYYYCIIFPVAHPHLASPCKAYRRLLHLMPPQGPGTHLKRIRHLPEVCCQTQSSSSPSSGVDPYPVSPRLLASSTRQPRIHSSPVFLSRPRCCCVTRSQACHASRARAVRRSRVSTPQSFIALANCCTLPPCSGSGTSVVSVDVLNVACRPSPKRDNPIAWMRPGVYRPNAVSRMTVSTG